MNRKRVGVAALAFAMAAGYTVSGGLGTFQNDYVQAETYAEEATTKTVVNEGTKWKYLDNNTDPAEGKESLQVWTEKGFDDSAWKEAAGKFGAKRGELTEFDGFKPTVLLQQYQSENGEDIPTYFFRTTFDVTNLEELTSVTGTLFHDDAVAVYLNGHKILSVDMPKDAQENNLFYAGVSAGAPKESKIALTAEQVKEYVVEGENVLSVELHNDRKDSSDIYLGFDNLSLNYNESPEEQPSSQKSVILTVGSDETSRNLTWYANTEEQGEVQYAPKSAMEGETFPENYETTEAVTNEANDPGFYSNQATIRNLAENTEYVYRVKNGDAVSKVYSFTTGKRDDAFSFALVGDPQIGTGDLQNGIDGWNQTLDVIQNKLDVDFIVSAGDQVNSAANETEYAGYLNETLASIPSASTVGNHDSASNAYGQHFNVPNESADKGTTEAGGDYWFVYNNTLFMDLNSNDRSAAEHKAFMEEAIAANPDVTWKTVIFHHSIYSTASHVNDGDIITRREELPPIFEDLDIDVVLMGHDHVYTRTYMMNEYTPDTSEGVQESVTDPSGILYLTANSGSGSKYYDIQAPNAEYAAKQDQSYRRTVTDIEVSDTSYTLTTYYADDMSVLDTFTINKTPEKDTSALENLIKEAGSLKEGEYTKESWKVFETALEQAKAVLSEESATQEDVEKAYNTLKEAMDSLKKAEIPGADDNHGQTTPDNEKPGTTPEKKPADKNAPKTGDMTNMAAMGLIFAGAGSVIVLSAKKKKTI